jgi:O-antigen/teichoic acid export membrane protein
MNEISENNKRIAKNTIFLYIRQIVILLVSLYTVRVVLNVLGVEDYGIYGVVGGVVSFFSFLSGTMASATQRFFSFALGQKDDSKLKKTFTLNWFIYGVIAIVALLLLETIGLWFVDNKLNVPPNRFEAALLLYHFSVFTFVATIISTPFRAIIIAHEDMKIYAYVSVVEALLKLAIVYLLVHIAIDKLELYGFLLLVVSILIGGIYIGYCVRKYSECQFKKFYWDKILLRELTGFTGWTLFGQITTVFRTQAITILLNQMFNPVVVAAQTIANNITANINMFSSNFNVGLYPPIIKYYASNNKKDMFALLYNGSKITFFLMWVFALPLFLEMDTVLQIWLKNPPPEAVLFTRLALVEALILSVSLPLTTAARAPGRMRMYELSLGSIQIAIFVAAWIVLAMGAAAYSVYIVAIIANLLMFAVRLIIVRGLIGLPLRPFCYKALLPISMIAVVSFLFSYIVHYFLPQGWIFSGVVIIFSVITSSICMYFIGLDTVERNKIKVVVKNKWNNLL